MRLKLLGALAAAAMLAGCAGNPAATNAGAATGTGAATSMTNGVAPGSEEDLVQNVGNRIFFAFNSSQLTPEDRATLDRQADWLQKYPQVTVQVAGNCDDRGTEEYNLALGERRANAARDYLVARGVNPARITTISYGKDRPVDPADNPKAWAMNRNDTTSVGGSTPTS
jgi:peptidoglycan-associated lipoprotein